MFVIQIRISQIFRVKPDSFRGEKKIPTKFLSKPLDFFHDFFCLKNHVIT